MNATQQVPLIIALAALVVAGAASWISMQEQPVSAHTHPTHIEMEDIEAIEMAIEHQGEKIGTERLNNMEMAKIISALQDESKEQQVAIDILEASGSPTTQPTTPILPTSSIDLGLKHTDNNLNFRSGGYPRDVPAILIEGFSTFIGKQFTIVIQAPDGSTVQDKFSKTLSDGDISEAWVPQEWQRQKGTYTVTISIDQRTDSIQFSLL